MIIPLFLSLSANFKQPSYHFLNPHYQQYQNELISVKYPNPSSTIKQSPVYIFAHGFGASPFEWSECKEFIENQSPYLISNVFLGAHHSLKAFKESSWKSWQEPLVNEYTNLVNKGFEHIIFCGCSTGATLLLQLLADQRLRPSLPIKELILIDPLIKPKEKLLYYMKILQRFISYTPMDLTKDEKEHWLPLRPTESLLQLLSLVRSTEKILKNGILIPSHIKCSVFQANNDPVLHSNAVKDLYNAVQHNGSNQLNFNSVESNKHVFTRLQGRKNITAQDIELQRKLFKYILNSAKK